MRSVDRALLIAHARRNGEETANVASRFGVTASTVRRLEAQLNGASSGEIAALRSGDLTLSVHAVIARHVEAEERDPIVRMVGEFSIRASELEALFIALGWRSLTSLGIDHQSARFELFRWSCETLAALDRGPTRQRFEQMAALLPDVLVLSQRASRTS
jgi:transposase-like protein